jgi:hypothetical protein
MLDKKALMCLLNRQLITECMGLNQTLARKQKSACLKYRTGSFSENKAKDF